MKHTTKRNKKILEIIDLEKLYSLKEAVSILKNDVPHPKFDESFDLNVVLSVDPRKADQQVRGTVSLPHGTGKKVVLVVITQGEKVDQAIEAGADYAGSNEILEKIKDGWTGFTSILATPDMMREIGKLGRVLGPRGLMPSPKAGTVTNDVEKAVKEIKAGKVEYKVDKSGVINNGIGRVSFSESSIIENARSLISAIVRAKPSAAKGKYIERVVISTTMGPGLSLNTQSLQNIGE